VGQPTTKWPPAAKAVARVQYIATDGDKGMAFYTQDLGFHLDAQNGRGMG
jgi:hypothetical protein